MSPEQFAAWLVKEGLAEEHSGYGHATGEVIAKALDDAGFYIERKVEL